MIVLPWPCATMPVRPSAWTTMDGADMAAPSAAI
jgi:hypothetical protein